MPLITEFYVDFSNSVILFHRSVISFVGSWADRSPLHEAASQGRLLALKTLLSQVGKRSYPCVDVSLLADFLYKAFVCWNKTNVADAPLTHLICATHTQHKYPTHMLDPCGTRAAHMHHQHTGPMLHTRYWNVEYMPHTHTAHISHYTPIIYTFQISFAYCWPITESQQPGDWCLLYKDSHYLFRCLSW